MKPIAVMLLLSAYATNPLVAAQQGPGASYQTTKDLTRIQKCLTDKLTERGDVTAANIEAL